MNSGEQGKPASDEQPQAPVDPASAPSSNGTVSDLTYVKMFLALLLSFLSVDLLLCIAVFRFTHTALEQLGKAGIPLPSKGLLRTAEKDDIKKKAFELLQTRLSSCTNVELEKMLRQFTQYAQVGDEWQTSGKFPNTTTGEFEKFHTQHHLNVAHIIEAIVAEVLTRGGLVSKRIFQKLDSSCVSMHGGKLRFGRGTILSEEISAILITNNKSVTALRKTLDNVEMPQLIRIKKQSELDAILANPVYLRTHMYYEEMLRQCLLIEATAKEGVTFEAFFLGREMCDTSSALIPLNGVFIVPHLDDSLDVPCGKTLDELNFHFAKECTKRINEILVKQSKNPDYTFETIELVGGIHSKSKVPVKSSSFEGVIYYWIVEFNEKKYYMRTKDKRPEMNHEKGTVSCVFTPGSPFTVEVYNIAMDTMLTSRTAKSDL